MHCTSCGTEKSDGHRFCSNCGSTFSTEGAHTGNPPLKEDETEKKEKIFLDDDSVLVSNSRYLVKSTGATYAMNQINTVAVWTVKPDDLSLLQPIGIAAAGLLFYYYIRPSGVFGVVTLMVSVGFLCLAVFQWKTARNNYFVLINTSNGSQQSLESADVSYCQKVVAALNEAIIYRQ